MALRTLEVRGFRILDKARFEFDPAGNYLFGPNGSGKTSILEAVHYVATGRSFRTRRDSELLRFDSELLSVSVEDDCGRVGQLVFDGREKRFELDGRRCMRLSEFFGWIPVVPLLLGDVELVSGVPARRRDYLDMAGAKVAREQIGPLNEYRKALLQYNRLLIERKSGEQLEVWEAELAKKGAVVTRQRTETARHLLGQAAVLASEFVGRPVAFHLKSNWQKNAEAGSPLPAVESGDSTDDTDKPEAEAKLKERLGEVLAASRRRAVELGYAPVGPHRDEVAIRVAGKELRRYGSVGEQRAVAIALRIAEAVYLGEMTRRPAVFLMDEVASELDERRAGKLFSKAGQAGQLLYAAARSFAVRGRIFLIDDGKVKEVQTA